MDFCVISNAELKSKIRIAAEEEERETYAKRMTERWRNDLAPLEQILINLYKRHLG